MLKPAFKGTFAYPTALTEYTFCAWELTAPAAASAAVSNSVFVLIWLVFVFLCVGAISQNAMTVSTLFCLFFEHIWGSHHPMFSQNFMSFKSTIVLLFLGRLS